MFNVLGEACGGESTTASTMSSFSVSDIEVGIMVGSGDELQLVLVGR